MRNDHRYRAVDALLFAVDESVLATSLPIRTLWYIACLSRINDKTWTSMRETWHLLKTTDFPSVTRKSLEILQVNLGYLCNQSCLHCHVNAGPRRKELMQRETIDQVLEVLERGGVHTLDLTGGAPEMNPMFRDLVTAARELGVNVIDRCNLTILLEPGYEGTAEFLAENGVQIVASLPCYLEDNVDGQRGKGVYQKSLQALRLLNRLGYGSEGGDLNLTLVYNPVGPYLPPPQQSLQQDYKKFLAEKFGINFNQLFTITNMPIARFGSTLLSKGEFEDYMNLLKDSFSAANMQGLMCINQLSIDWQGYVYDCDFNQMLNMNVRNPDNSRKLHISDLLETSMQDIPVSIADHCYGCTAGQGSSCGGALA
jgi:radical SAM/Cys-rich protein